MEYNIYQNNNISNNNQTISNINRNETNVVLNTKVKVKTSKSEIVTKIIGETNNLIVTYEGKTINKKDIISITKL